MFRNLNTSIYFVIVLLLFLLGVKVAAYSLTILSNVDEDLKILCVGVLYTFMIFFVSKLCVFKEGFESSQIDPCNCKGGEYLYQDDSERSIKCRKLYSTKSGRKLIKKCSCSHSQIGEHSNNSNVHSNNDISCLKTEKPCK